MRRALAETAISEPAIGGVVLDPANCGDALFKFRDEIACRLIGQPAAVQALADTYRSFITGLRPPNRPIAVLLFAGGTGVGKSKAAEIFTEVVLGNPQGMLRIDCAEYRHSHEIAKLLGSPAGYLGHRETEPLLSQQRIDKHQTPDTHLNVILFDEIEKGHDALWNLLLGIFDKGFVQLGNGHSTTFDDSVIIMTTNLGAKEIEKIRKGAYIGFAERAAESASAAADSAIRGNFTPEFINRIDHIVIFEKLDRDALRRILDIELQKVHERILFAKNCPIFVLCFTPDAKELLLNLGTDDRYGARELKRTIERIVVQPIANLIASKQVIASDILTVDRDSDKLRFIRTSNRKGDSH